MPTKKVARAFVMAGKRARRGAYRFEASAVGAGVAGFVVLAGFVAGAGFGSGGGFGTVILPVQVSSVPSSQRSSACR